MEVLIKLNSQTAGRDKLIRLLQYLSRFLSHKIQQNGGRDVDRLRSLEYTFSTFRKLLRLGRCLDTLYSVLPLINHPNVAVRITLSLSKISSSLFLLADHMIWLSRSGVCELDTEKWSSISNRYWLYSITMNLVRDMYEIYQILRCEQSSICPRLGCRTINDVLISTGKALIRVQSHRDVMIDAIKNSCDLFIPLTALGYTKLSPSTIGFLGVISSVAGSFVAEMKIHFVDCFMLMGTALSIRGNNKLPEMGRPLIQDVFTTTVNTSITLSQMYFENIKDMEVRFTFLLHQRWLDPRLGANQRTRKLAVNGQIWRPHITSTEGDAYVKENDVTQYWRGVGPEGNILYSEKVNLKTFCTTNFRKFPFDTQSCAIKLGSYRFPKEEVDLIWNKIPIEILTGTDLKEFKLVNVNTYSEVEVRPSGNFTVLVAQITIKRFYEHYIFCTIAPCSLMVVLSYFVFWLNPRNITIRYFLSGINLFLLMYYYHYSACATIPVPYMKALDIFIAICSSFAFLALLENIAIDVIFRKENIEEYGSRIFHKVAISVYITKYKLLDRIACAMYPIIFTCVMLFYCIMFLA